MTNKQTIAYPLRLPHSLRQAVARYAKQEGISINQFIALATAEKISVLDTELFFQQRANKADMKSFWDLMQRDGGEPPRAGDEMPKGSTHTG